MSEIKVGLLAIATLATIVYMSLLVTSNQSGFGEYVPYRTIVRDASGIFPKTPIKVAGINAGRIKKIELLDNNALITFEVLERVKITKKSRLKIKTVGFLGDKYLEIIIGQSDERIEEMGFIPSEESGGVENLVKDVADVMKDVKDIVKDLKSALSPGDGTGIKKIIKDLEITMENTKETTATLKRVMTGNEEKLNNLIANMEKFSKSLSSEFDKDINGSTLADVKEIMGNAKKLTDDLQTLIADMKNGKGTVGKLLVEDDIADEVQQTLSSVKKLVGRVDQIRTELSIFSGANSDYGAESDLSLKIFPAPERFYSLGVTTSEFGPETERYTTTITDGVSSNEIRKERIKDEFRFSVQLGRKVHNWVFRGGLIETTGGIGVDYEVPSWGSRFSMEVFDYRKSIGANLRLSTEFQVWNVLYGKMSLEDVALNNRSATIFAGLKFSDEDLKGLLGFFL